MTVLQQPPPLPAPRNDRGIETITPLALSEHARLLIESADAPNTRRAYAADFRAWRLWCAGVDVDPTRMPVEPEIAAAWLASQSACGLAPATIRRRSAWLGRVHRDAGLPSPSESPLVSTLLRGVRRNGAPTSKKRPLTTSMVRVAVPLLEARDRAMVLVGLVTGLRRSDLTSLRWGQIEHSPGGRVIHLGRTKTKEAGSMVGVPRGSGDCCPVRALTDLALEQGGEDPLRPVFGCGGAAVGRLVKRIAVLAGEDPRQFGGHSLRAGFATEASRLGIQIGSIMAQSGHASVDVAASYIRHSEADANPAALALVRDLNG
jgi:integrase